MKLTWTKLLTLATKILKWEYSTVRESQTEQNKEDNRETEQNKGDNRETEQNKGDNSETEKNTADNRETQQTKGDDGKNDQNKGDDGKTKSNVLLDKHGKPRRMMGKFRRRPRHGKWCWLISNVMHYGYKCSGLLTISFGYFRYSQDNCW